MKNKECKMCSIQPKFIVDRYNYYESTIDLGSGCSGWTSLRRGKDENNKVVIIATGDDSEYYYPKYCPECGRKLHD